MACTNCKDSILNNQDSSTPNPKCVDNCPEDLGCGDTLDTGCIIYNGSALECLDVSNGDTLNLILSKVETLCVDSQSSSTVYLSKISSTDTCPGYLEDKIISSSLNITVQQDGMTYCETLVINEKNWSFVNFNPINGRTWFGVQTGYAVKNQEVRLKGGVLIPSTANSAFVNLYTLPTIARPSENKSYSYVGYDPNIALAYLISIIITTAGQIQSNVVPINNTVIPANAAIIVPLDFISFLKI